jgi:hypothetical protein
MEENKDGLSRRNFLVNGSAAIGALGLAAGFGAGSLVNPGDAHAAMGAFYKPASLDVERVRNLGFYWYKQGPGCGHGSARALIQAFAEASELEGQTATAWHDIPRNLYSWCNGGGPSSWGVLCGALGGSVGVLNLIDSGALVASLGQAMFEWYVKQPFPGDLDSFPAGLTSDGKAALTAVNLPIPLANVKAQVVPDSVLCHISVSKWLAAAGVYHGQVEGGHDLRADRCAKVTGETAAHAAFLYNEWKAGRNPAGWTKPAAMAGCFDCHDVSGPATLTNKSAATKMDCLPCHSEPVSGRK